MFEQLLIDFGVLGAGIGIFLTINTLFFKADDFFSKEFKDDAALFLLCVEPAKNISKWPLYFVLLFDKLFKKKVQPDTCASSSWRRYVSWHTFFRSCIASTISICIMIVIGLSVGLLGVNSFGVQNTNELIKFASFPVLCNFIPDYLSLLQTRYFMEIVKAKATKLKLFVVLLFDVAVTISIVIVSITFSGWLIVNIVYGNEVTFIDVFENILSQHNELFWFKKDTGGNMVGVFVYSTFFTSIWIWLFGISNILLSMASRSQHILKIVKYMLPIEEKPFRSIGIIAGLFAMVSYWSIAIFI